MYGREELERATVKKWLHSEWEIIPDENGEFFWADDVNPVLDKMEAKINELEKRLEDVQNTMATENVDLGMENFKLKDRIKELEAVISKMETTTPKWISVKDRLPRIRTRVHTFNGEEVEENWIMYDSQWMWSSDQVTHWMQLPPPPITEEI